MAAEVMKDRQDAWVQFASAALNGLVSTGNWDTQAAEKAAEYADKLLAEFDLRVERVHGE